MTTESEAVLSISCATIRLCQAAIDVWEAKDNANDARIGAETPSVACYMRVSKQAPGATFQGCFPNTQQYAS